MNEQILKRELRKEKGKWAVRYGMQLLVRTGALMLAILMVAGMLGLLQHASSSMAAGNFRQNNGVYMLKVETGAAAGDTVLFIGIRYVDRAGVKHTHYLYPHEGSLTQGFDVTPYATGMQNKLDIVKKIANYAPDGAAIGQGLKANSTDYYVFSPRFSFASLEGIDVFMSYPKEFDDVKGQALTDEQKAAKAKQKAETAGISLDWTCNGIYFYRVDEIYSVEMEGYYSANQFVSFRGEVIGYSNQSAVDFTLGRSDRMFRISALDANGQKKDILAYDRMSLTVPQTPVAYNSKDCTYTIKLDFADVYGAGVETNASLYEANGLKGPVENLGMVITYVDNIGKTRIVKVPVVTSALAYAVEKGFVDSSLPVVGVGQQGDSLIVPVKLPELNHFTRIEMEVGGKAVATAGIAYASGSQTQEQKERMQLVDSDIVRLAGMQIYKGEVVVSRTSNSAELDLEVAEGYYPLYYFTASTRDGVLIQVGRTELWSRLGQYYYGNALTPPETKGNYLVVVRTDDMDLAGTTSPVTISLRYDSVDGTTKVTPTYNLADLALDYYGFWPGNTGITESIGYAAGMSPGGEMIFTMNISDVNRFTGINLSMPAGSSDDWQMKELLIYDQTEVGPRVAKWGNFKGMSDRIYSRSYSADDTNVVARFPIETVEVNENGEEVPVTAALLLTGQSNSKEIKIEPRASRSVVQETEDLDWAAMLYNMSFSDTQKDLQFSRSRCNYEIAVKVAGNDQANTMGSDGDTGSKNLFYFQLIFEYGTSSYVLSNQQLASDRYRAGMTETFYISTNRDFGNVTAVNIIPGDNSDGDGDNQYYMDKLNIENIKIAKLTNSNVVQTWKIDSVGWVDINYIDNAQQASMGGRPARYESDMAKTYKVTSTGYEAQFMFAIKTGSYKPEEGVLVDDYAQLSGAVMGTLTYKSGDEIKTTSFDLIKAIYEYAEQNPMYYDSGLAIGKARPDQSYMFRANHIDRFYVRVPDVTSVTSLIIGVSAEMATRWDIQGVTVYQVEGDGSLAQSIAKEYVNSQEVTYLTESLSVSTGVLQTFGPEMPTQIVGAEQERTIRFADNEIQAIQVGTDWSSAVTAAPTSKNDTLNLYVYLKGKATDGYQLDAKLWWHSGLTQQIRREALSGLTKGASGNMFYILDIPATGVDAVQALHLVANGPKTYTDMLDYAVVQHVRDGVTMDNTYFNLNGLSLIGMYSAVTPSGNLSEMESDRQVVYLQIGEVGDSFELNRGQDDIMVALNYRSENDASGGNNATFSTVYSYVSDVTKKGTYDKAYTSISPGMVLEIPFDEPFISEVTGIQILGVGKAAGLTVECAAIDIRNRKTDESKRWISFASGAMLSITPKELVATETEVSLVDMTFKTNVDAQIATQGLMPKLQMNVNYINYRSGVQETQMLADANMYLTSGAFLKSDSGNTATIRFMLKGANTIRSVGVYPLSGSDTLDAHWGVGATSAVMYGHTNALDSDGADMGPAVVKNYSNPNVDKLVVQGTPYTINLSPLYVSAKAMAYNATTKMNETAQTAENGSASITVPSGVQVTIYPTVTGSLYGNLYNVTAMRNVVSDGTNTGISVNTFKDDGSKIVFETPKNTSSEVVTYTLTISSYEYPEAAATIVIYVEGTGEDEAEAQKKLEEAADELKKSAEDLKKQQESVSGNN